MGKAEQRAQVFITSLIKPGDIVLSTTPAIESQAIRFFTGSDISHAMICVANGSVIDSTGDGVHARNLARILLEPGCAGHVLRPRTPLTPEQLNTVITYARAAVGTSYTVTNAMKSVAAGFVAGKKQFCSRLVAQAYRAAGVDLVPDADFCHPGELLESVMLAEVPDVLRSLSYEEEAYLRGDTDNVQEMRNATNALLVAARKHSSKIESLNDINDYLIANPGKDEVFVEMLKSSGYLTEWEDECKRNAWQYEVDLMDRHERNQLQTMKYCENLLADETLAENRFIVNHAGFITLNTRYPRQFFELMIDLYDRLTHLHAQRVKAATVWLERRGLREPMPPVLQVPHTVEWFDSLRKWNPTQAALTDFIITKFGSTQICTICGDDPASDYVLEYRLAAGPGTLRLCDDCFRIRNPSEPMRPL